MSDILKLTLITGIIVFIVSIVLMPFIIPLLHRLKFGQTIRVEGPKSHLKKQGTPTMGGIIFVLISVLTMLIIHPDYFFKPECLVITCAFLGYFIIGLIDDLLIVVFKSNDGLSIKMKLLLQAIVIIGIILIYPNLFFNSELSVIDCFFFKVNLHYGYIVFAILMFVSYTNAINFTDGLDGLASSTMIIALIFMGIIAYFQKSLIELSYIGAVIGGLLGFLVFNKKPAKIFMGDTGSLALGGFYAMMALLLKIEMLSIVIGMVFVLEALSVVIQIVYFKTTHKRFFKMAPLHHHFEMGTLKERGSVFLLATMGLIFGLLGMVIYFG
ncbi:MAG: phospho-N-acetylmuramoyl-pentapeptide-transferase [Bacilli bacterium]|jgi:phospho-N-acetylmuramoyl-pentapeptide-transferase|nr:phospho-N-acetylmuramoyl-pentapeptide-transferase [Bacilli bacterium]